MEFNFQLKKNMKSILVLWVMLFIHEIAHKIVHDLKEHISLQSKLIYFTNFISVQVYSLYLSCVLT